MKKYKNNNNKAITLIALVITIVVLIILAGVIISITISNGGIIDRAKTAKQEYANAEGYEQEQIAKTTNEIDSYIDGNRGVELTDDVKAYINSKITSTSTGVPQGTAVSGYSFGDWRVEKQGNRIFVSGYVNGSWTKDTSKKVATGLPAASASTPFIGASYNNVLAFGNIDTSGELFITSNNYTGSAAIRINFSYTTTEQLPLVIKIVVFIILAGVIISITLGNGGIIDRAKVAGQKYANAQKTESELSNK